MHSASAGLEHLLFSELVEGPVTLTNAKVGEEGRAWGLEEGPVARDCKDR
jgi:hypothetical protein